MSFSGRHQWKESRDLHRMVPVHGVMTMLRYAVGTLRLEGSSTSRVPSTGVSSFYRHAATHDVPLGQPEYISQWREAMDVRTIFLTPSFLSSSFSSLFFSSVSPLFFCCPFFRNRLFSALLRIQHNLDKQNTSCSA